jgi:hypothetical protein
MVVERVVLGLDRAVVAGVVPAGEALGNEALHARRVGRGKEMLGALRAQLVGHCEPLVEVLEVGRAGERRHLVDDGIRLGPGDRLSDAGGVEAVDDDRLGAERAQQLDLVLRPRRGDDAVAAVHQLGHEPAADRSGGSCEEDAHVRFLSSRWDVGP